MISIVICSINEVFFKSIQQSIVATIGIINYEIIKVDNKKVKRSLSEAYNVGLEKAKFEIVVFVHEDVIFHTQDWGKILLGHFESNPTAGLIGVAGSTLKLKTPSSWFNVPKEFHVINIIQHIGEKDTRHDVIGWKSNDEFLKEISIADGVFLAMRKIKDIYFDERIPGFHGYDLAISLTYKTHGFSIFATKKILIEHFSIGVLDKSWIRAMFDISRLYKDQLPLAVHKVSSFKNLELEKLKSFIHKALDLNERRIAFFCFIRVLLMKPLSFQNIVFVKRLLFR